MLFLTKHSSNEDKYRPISDLFNSDKEYFLNRQKEGIQYLIDEFGIERIFKNYIYGFLRSSYLSETEWAKKFWHYANELTRIIFDLNLHPDIEVEIEYNGERLLTKGFQKRGMPIIYDCGNFEKYAQQAIISRDKKQIQNLLQIDTETMFRKIAEYGSLIPEEIDPNTHDFYLSLLSNDDIKALEILRMIIEKITSKPRSCFKNYASIAEKRDYVDLLLLPFYTCLASVLEQNQNNFDTLLFDALEKHKEWSMVKLRSPKNSLYIPNSNAPESFVSIPLLAACSLAYDKGMTINVESDYIPEWLYKNFSY